MASPQQNILLTRTFRRMAWCGAAAIAFSASASFAEIKPITPPVFDIGKVCRKMPGFTKPSRDWTVWDGSKVALANKELLPLAMLYYRGDASTPASLPTAAKFFELILKNPKSPETNDARYYLGKMLLDGKAIAQDAVRGVALLEEALKNGERGATFELGYYYERMADYAKAATYYQRGISMQSVGSARKIAWYYKDGKIPAPSPDAYEKLIHFIEDTTLERLARGECSSFHQFGTLYSNGEAVDKNFPLAAQWFEAASNAGKVKSTLKLADMNRNATGIPRNMAKAIALWKKAAAEGSETAMYNIGMSFLLGDGVKQDDDTAILWLSKAGERHHRYAMEKLSKIYHGDYGRKAEPEKSVQWMERAASLPNVSGDVLVSLATAYTTGYGTAHDNKKAFSILERATANGDPDGTKLLAEAILFGRGTEQRPTYSLRFFRLAALRGNTAAMMQMAENYTRGIGVKPDAAKAQLWRDRAAALRADSALLLKVDALEKQGDKKGLEERAILLKRMTKNDSRTAMALLGAAYLTGYGVEKDGDAAEEWFKKAILPGDKDKQSVGYKAMADLYLKGKGGIKTDTAEGLKWLQKAVDAGNTDDEFLLGKFYLLGLEGHIKPDPAKAITYFTKAAAAQHPGALQRLGKMHEEGNGVPADAAKARDYLTAAAEYGNLKAAGELARLYENNPTLSNANAATAVAWYYHSALLGDPSAMLALARAYAKGYGVKKDSEQAAAWFNKAAESGTPRAMRELGYAYLNGNGVEADVKKAITWFEKAAEAGDVKSMVELAQSYASGYGVKESSEKALTWWKKAADAGSVEAKNYLKNVKESGYGPQ